MKDISTTIISNERVAEDIFRLRVAAHWPSFTPGQFVMLKVPSTSVFLRRPFGIASLAEGILEICYKVVGKGTHALSLVPSGSEVSVFGPCGRGFALPQGIATAVLVAGGYGIAPLIGLARSLRETNKVVHLYYGAKNSRHFFYLDDIECMGVKLFLSTEDGSLGGKGLVTELLEKDIVAKETPALFACGPHGLIRTVAYLGIVNGIPAQVSLETSMACGIGVCQGCVCKNSTGDYVRICREGPVFDVRDLSNHYEP